MPDVSSASERLTESHLAFLKTGGEIVRANPDFKLEGREDQLRKIYNVLLRERANNVLMYGPGGVGMSTLAKGIQFKKDDLTTPHEIVNKRFMWLKVDALMASGNGKKIIEDFEKILRRLALDPNTVLVIEDFADFLKAASKNGASSIINALMRDIKSKKFQTILEVRVEELGSVLKDYHSDLTENFTRVQIEEPKPDVTQRIVDAVKPLFERKGIKVADDATKEAVALTVKYPKVPTLDRAQPERALNLIDQSMSEYRNEANSRPARLPAIEAELASLAKEADQKKAAARKTALEAERAKVVAEWEAQQKRIRDLNKQRGDLREQRDQAQLDYDDMKAKSQKNAREALRKSNDGSISTADLDEIASTNVDTPEMRENMELVRACESDIKLMTDEIVTIGRKQSEGLVLGAKEVRDTFSRLSGIPVNDLTEDDSARLEKMEEELGKRVFGQDYAIKQLAKTVRIARAGLKEPEKPIGSFMFNGPTGVGKTEIVKALAQFLYKDEFAVTRIDMSEYMEKVAVNKMIGAPPGYAGYEEGGALTNAVRARPNQIILLDEIDKAHPDVFNVLLQVLDAGRLTDGQGVTVDFKETLVIMTSNLGAHFFQDPALSFDQASAQMMQLVKSTFKPEFLNRIDEIIGFNALAPAIIEKVVRKEFNKIGGYLKDKGVAVDISDECIKKITDNHYDPTYGGRGIVRYLKMNAKDKLAAAVLDMPKGQAGGIKLVTRYNDAAKTLEVLRETVANTNKAAPQPLRLSA